MASSRIMVFVPMYRCERQIGRVIDQFSPEIQRRFAEILLIDNRSPDGTLDAACKAAGAKLDHVNWTVVRNRENYGLGGSQKVAFEWCLEKNYDGAVILHGDDQGSIADILEPLDAWEAAGRTEDCLLGARFMPGSRLEGYSGLRTLGNHVFNLAFSAVCGRRLYDLGAGLNFYRRAFLEDRAFLRCADGLEFNYYLLLQTVAKGASFRFFPLTWREDDQISNVKMIRQATRMVEILARYALSPERFLAADFASRDRYETETIESGGER